MCGTWCSSGRSSRGCSASVDELETARLALRRFTLDDAAFILELVNEPSFLRHIGDKGVRSEEDARRYLRSGPLASYERFGFGLYAVELRDGREPIGMCGLLKREALPDPDVGFAFLPRYWSKGYALEAVTAILDDARARHGLTRLLAITSQDNVPSIALLEKVDFMFEGMARMSGDAEEIRVYSRTCLTGLARPR
jgi:ribosomal-protein-alanine N-acetyltransferase